MDKIIMTLSFLFFMLLPCVTAAQWTINPTYNVGTPTYTFDQDAQDAIRINNEPQTPPENWQEAPGQPQRIDPRTVRKFDNRIDMRGMGRLDVRERPNY